MSLHMIQKYHIYNNVLRWKYRPLNVCTLNWSINVLCNAAPSLSPSQDSEFVCLEFDEAKINQVLKKMADIQESIDNIVHHT